MKKMVALILTVTIVMTLAFPAFAVEEEYLPVTGFVELQCEESEDYEGVMPRASLSLGFQLASGKRSVSSERYYISDENGKLYINSSAWSPQGVEIGIGWYRVDTGVIYYVRYSGGSANMKLINSDGLPDGYYRVAVVNLGEETINGAIHYNVF